MSKAKKNILIAGVPRAGKTTLSQMVCRKLGVSHQSIDALVHSMEATFPDLGLSFPSIRQGDLQRKLEPLLLNFWEGLEEYEVNFVVDTCHTMPAWVVDRRLQEKAHVVFLGFTDVDIAEKVRIIREFERPKDWSRQCDDYRLYEIVKNAMDLSGDIKKECVRYNIPYFDTSHSFDDVLSDACEFLVSSYE